MKVCWVTCFAGRHDKVERVIKCFMDQVYDDFMYLLLYNNSKTDQFLDYIEMPENKQIILVNNHLDEETKQEYTNTGAIFRDALNFVPKDVEVINFADSDDIFLPNHTKEGIKGYKDAISINPDFKAYKPFFSYYLHDDNQVDRSHNNMEPSIFVNFDYVKNTGFHYVPASYHQKWLTPLQKNYNIYQPLKGVPTFLYCWESGHNTHKISGLGDHADNFINHRKFEVDDGDGVLSPASDYEVEKYYTLIKRKQIANFK